MPQAAAKGHAGGMYHLAILHHKGQGVEKSDAECTKWLGKAAELGDRRASRMLVRQGGCPHAPSRALSR